MQGRLPRSPGIRLLWFFCLLLVANHAGADQAIVPAGGFRMSADYYVLSPALNIHRDEMQYASRELMQAVSVSPSKRAIFFSVTDWLAERYYARKIWRDFHRVGFTFRQALGLQRNLGNRSDSKNRLANLYALSSLVRLYNNNQELSDTMKHQIVELAVAKDEETIRSVITIVNALDSVSRNGLFSEILAWILKGDIDANTQKLHARIRELRNARLLDKKLSEVLNREKIVSFLEGQRGDLDNHIRMSDPVESAI